MSITAPEYRFFKPSNDYPLAVYWHWEEFQDKKYKRCIYRSCVECCRPHVIRTCDGKENPSWTFCSFHKNLLPEFEAHGWNEKRRRILENICVGTFNNKIERPEIKKYDAPRDDVTVMIANPDQSNIDLSQQTEAAEADVDCNMSTTTGEDLSPKIRRRIWPKKTARYEHTQGCIWNDKAVCYMNRDLSRLVSIDELEFLSEIAKDLRNETEKKEDDDYARHAELFGYKSNDYTIDNKHLLLPDFGISRGFFPNPSASQTEMDKLQSKRQIVEDAMRKKAEELSRPSQEEEEDQYEYGGFRADGVNQDVVKNDFGISPEFVYFRRCNGDFVNIYRGVLPRNTKFMRMMCQSEHAFRHLGGPQRAQSRTAEMNLTQAMSSVQLDEGYSGDNESDEVEAEAKTIDLQSSKPNIQSQPELNEDIEMAGAELFDESSNTREAWNAPDDAMSIDHPTLPPRTFKPVLFTKLWYKTKPLVPNRVMFARERATYRGEETEERNARFMFFRHAERYKYSKKGQDVYLQSNWSINFDIPETSD